MFAGLAEDGDYFGMLGFQVFLFIFSISKGVCLLLYHTCYVGTIWTHVSGTLELLRKSRTLVASRLCPKREY